MSLTFLERISLVLVATRNPLNIGAVARAMANFGFSDLRLVSPYDVAFREARSAVGAEGVLAKAQTYENLAEAVADCSLVIGTSAARNRQLDAEVVPLQKATGRMGDHAPSRVALLFGSEKRGLSNRDLSYCHWIIRIPTVTQTPSMNLAQAVAVCLYEIVRGGTGLGGAVIAREQLSPNSAELDRLNDVLLDCLKCCHYFASASPNSGLQIRRFVRRLNLSSRDSEVLTGMLRQMLWKMRQG
jgi:tRNA/rRNA methyltransferase